MLATHEKDVCCRGGGAWRWAQAVGVQCPWRSCCPGNLLRSTAEREMLGSSRELDRVAVVFPLKSKGQFRKIKIRSLTGFGGVALTWNAEGTAGSHVRAASWRLLLVGRTAAGRKVVREADVVRHGWLGHLLEGRQSIGILAVSRHEHWRQN